MKKLILVLTIALATTGCATVQHFNAEDATPEGIKYKYGSSQGIKIGDKVNAFKKVPALVRPGYVFDPIGSLTIIKVEDDVSFMKQNTDFKIDNTVSFFKD